MWELRATAEFHRKADFIVKFSMLILETDVSSQRPVKNRIFYLRIIISYEENKRIKTEGENKLSIFRIVYHSFSSLCPIFHRFN